MMTGELFFRIRTLYDREHLRVSQIARLLQLNMKTVAKWVRRSTFQPRPRVSRPSKLDAYKGHIVRLLGQQGLSGAQLLVRLREQGYTGGYSILKAYLHRIRPPRHRAFVTLAYAPGESAQVDWGHAGVLPVGSTQRRLSFLVVVLCYSRRLYVEFTLGQAMEQFLGALQRALEYFGAVPGRVMVDNMKTAVLSHPLGLPAVYHPRFLEFAAHYGFEPRACGVRQPQAKGRVENAVRYVRGSFLNGMELSNLSAINGAARAWLDTVANLRVHRETHQKPFEMFEEERAALRPLNPAPCDTGLMRPIRVSSRCRVSVDANRYSVPSEFASRRLTLHLGAESLRLYAEQKLVAEHVRRYDRHQDYENPDHVRALLQQRKGARDQALLRRFLALSGQAEAFYRELESRALSARHHVRQIVALTELYPPEQVARALEDAAAQACYRAEYVANILAMRSRPRSEPGALHLTRRQDLLDLELPPPDLSIYDPSEPQGDTPHESP